MTVRLPVAAGVAVAAAVAAALLRLSATTRHQQPRLQLQQRQPQLRLQRQPLLRKRLSPNPRCPQAGPVVVAQRPSEFRTKPIGSSIKPFSTSEGLFSWL